MKNSNKKHGDKHQHDPEIDALIPRLERASKRLNVAAQQATRRIEALEERLVSAEPGVEFWGPTLITEQITFQREGSEGGESVEAAVRVVTLGYAKVKKDKWGIAVREVVKASSGGGLLSEKSSLLHKAERNLRLLALPHLTSLTRQIVEAIEAQTVGLEDDADDDEASTQGESARHADN
jgi:hypothetical protein